MSSKDLGRIQDNLHSEKVRERQDGLQQVKELLPNDAACRKFDAHAKEPGDTWLFLFQSLFTAIATERVLCTRKNKSSAAAARRLSDAAFIMRDTTIKSVPYLSRKPLKPLLTHLMETMIHRTQLVEEVALDYAKALKAIVSFQPHLDHVSDELWIKLLHFAFSVLLGDPLSSSVTFEAAVAGVDVMDIDQEEPKKDVEEEQGGPSSDNSVSETLTRKRRHSSKSARRVRTLSPVQVEFAGVIYALLRSPTSPYLSIEQRHLPKAILLRFQRFYETYPTETSAHYTILASLNSILPNLSLNFISLVTSFGHHVWHALLDLWGAKQTLRESIVIALRSLLPFIANPNEQMNTASPSSIFDKVYRLCRLLDAEADFTGSKSMEALALDSLRLEIRTETCERAFVSHTLRSGHGFRPAQALTWAAMELQSDCLVEATRLAEFRVEAPPNPAKRRRLDISATPPASPAISSTSTPLIKWLEKLSLPAQQRTVASRTYRLQILVFIVERHWASLEDEAHNLIRHIVRDHVNGDEPTLQAWAFLCQAAWSYACTSIPASDLDSLWTNAFRRINIVGLSRTASHAAHILLTSHHFNSPRLLADLDILSNDLGVQGPSYPYDAVCSFLRQCVHLASQDTRSHKLRLEEKIIGWLVENWNIANIRRPKLEAHTMGDILALLEGLLGFQRHHSFLQTPLLPVCSIVDAVVAEQETAITRDYLLRAQFPNPLPSSSTSTETVNQIPKSKAQGSLANLQEKPTARIAKVSSFFERSLRSVISEWHSISDLHKNATPEKIRNSIDFGVLSLMFQATVQMNGFRATPRVLQFACELIGAILPALPMKRWNLEDRATILIGLEPLVRSQDGGNERLVDLMAHPTNASGIPFEQFLQRERRSVRSFDGIRTMQESHNLMWEGSDIQELFARESGLSLSEALKSTMYAAAGLPDPSAIINEDQFRGSAMGSSEPDESSRYMRHDHPLRLIFRIAISLLTVAPMLQSRAIEPTRDRSLVEIALSFENDKLFLIGPEILRHHVSRHIALTTKDLGEIADELQDRLFDWAYSRCEELILLILDFLEATTPIWCDPSQTTNDIAPSIQQLLFWLMKLHERQKLRSWRARNRLLLLMHAYVVADPGLVFWNTKIDQTTSPEDNAIASLTNSIFDEDVRVRVRSALLGPSLLLREASFIDAKRLHNAMLRQTTDENEPYEVTLTRLLVLGNEMIISAEVRRAPYGEILKHGIERPAAWTRHSEAILKEVAHRLRFDSLSKLFLPYAAQIGLYMSDWGLNYVHIPPPLVGCASRREIALATYQHVLPINLLSSTTGSRVDYGQEQLKNFARLLQLNEESLLRDIFATRAALKICTEFDVEDEAGMDVDRKYDEVLDTLRHWASECTLHGETPDALLANRVHEIVFVMLRSVGSVSVSSSPGSISEAIEQEFPNSAAIFAALTRFKVPGDYDLTRPNAPLYSPAAVLQGIKWLSHTLPIPSHAIYHVLVHAFQSAEETRIIGEQLRYINIICILTAWRGSDFQQPVLLKMLLFGASVLLGQVDIARHAQSIIDWALGVYASMHEGDIYLAEVLSRVARIAANFSMHFDTRIRSIGDELLTWLETQVENLLTVQHCWKDALTVLLVWPRPLPRHFATILSQNPSIDAINMVLRHEELSTNKFRIVQRLRDERVSLDVANHDSHEDFWDLKACIPEISQLNQNDVSAFIHFLRLCAHNVRPVSRDSVGPQGISSTHRLKSNAGRKPSDNSGRHSFVELSPKPLIIQALLRNLYENSITTMYLAYQSLRLVLAHSKEDTKSASELSFLSFSPLTPREPAPVSLDSLLVIPTAHFDAWLVNVTRVLCDALSQHDGFYGQLEPVIVSDVAFAQDVFPVALHALLYHELGKEEGSERPVRDALTTFATQVLQDVDADLSCIRMIIDTVLHLRHFTPSSAGKKSSNSQRTSSKDPLPLSSNLWLGIDHSLLATCSTRCGAYTTALLFYELSQESLVAQPQPPQEEMLYEIYRQIQEPDGFYGIQNYDADDFLLRRMHHEQQWSKALQFHGAQFEAGGDVLGSTHQGSGIVQSMHALGFDQLAASVHHSIGGHTSNDYPVAWRNGDWDLPNTHLDHDPRSTVYVALRAIHRERDPLVLQSVVHTTIRREMAHLRAIGNENMMGLYESMQRLLCLDEVDQWIGSSSLVSSETPVVFQRFGPDNDFQNIESVTATRVSLLRASRQREETQMPSIGNLPSPNSQRFIDAEIGCLYRLTQAARAALMPQIALNSIVRARHLNTIVRQTANIDLSREFASVLWMHQEEKSAVAHLEALLQPQVVPHSKNIPLSVNVKQALIRAQLGDWLSQTSLRPPLEIKERFFEPAVEMVQLSDSAADRASVAYQYALFAQRQYTSTMSTESVEQLAMRVQRQDENAYQYSLALEALKAQKKEEEEAKDRQVSAKTSAAISAIQSKKREADWLSNQEKQYLKMHQQKLEGFLKAAITMLSQSLTLSDMHDIDGILRLTSLWFSSFDEEALIDYIEDSIRPIPSHKFIKLVHQLSARHSSPTPSDTSVGSSTALQDLMLRLCSEHPFHSLYQVNALRYMDLQASSHITIVDPLSQRQDIANRLLDATRTQADPKLRKRMDEVDVVCRLSIAWANLQLPKDIVQYRATNKQFSIKTAFRSNPQAQQLAALRNLDIPVTTADTPTDLTCEYSTIVCWTRFADEFSVASGLSMPKISHCQGSDGTWYRQLYKGRDDLRQDAIMEQMFDLTNHVLYQDRETRRRNLSIRTYKVIPLSPDAGIIEFVPSTMPLQSWLSRAHPRYYPEDIKARDASIKLSKTREDCMKKKIEGDKLAEHLFKTFEKIQERYRPVMRHFFTEFEKDPLNWFEMRLRYSRSVASSSIIGHVIGLGDRHLSNLLLDTTSGEVVQIDLGIAFDGGRMLGIPETVPFRLTADMVDGFGVSGTEGVFRRCAEETLRVLREDGAAVVKTVLEVFKYDPLHKWTANPLKMVRVQQDEPGAGGQQDEAAEAPAGDKAVGTKRPRLSKGKTPEPPKETKKPSQSKGKTPEPLFERKGSNPPGKPNESKDIEHLEGSVEAERALRGVHRKLDTSLSVEYTVNELITAARDPRNLSQMFGGWAPWS